MYAIRPWGKAYIVGSTVGSMALAIGMRMRETLPEIIESRPSPHYELSLSRRCVIPRSTLNLLRDLGVREEGLRPHLRPTKAWAVCTIHDLAVIHTDARYAGCAPEEPSYHIEYGRLLRHLRRDFLRYGGSLSWDSTAFDAFEAEAAIGRWAMRKSYGLANDAEAIVSYAAANTHLSSLLFAQTPHATEVVFDVRFGLCKEPPSEVAGVLAKFSAVLVAGRHKAFHLWAPRNGTCAWRLIAPAEVGTGGKSSVDDGEAHAALTELTRRSETVALKPCRLPTHAPTFRDNLQHIPVTAFGNALLPIDPFEWRADRAAVEIAEAAAFCRALYGNQYHRGHVAHIMRDEEQDALARRIALLKRDLKDAENLMQVQPRLPVDEEEPLPTPPIVAEIE